MTPVVKLNVVKIIKTEHSAFQFHYNAVTLSVWTLQRATPVAGDAVSEEADVQGRGL
jgi:hypothetical protein